MANIVFTYLCFELAQFERVVHFTRVKVIEVENSLLQSVDTFRYIMYPLHLTRTPLPFLPKIYDTCSIVNKISRNIHYHKSILRTYLSTISVPYFCWYHHLVAKNNGFFRESPFILEFLKAKDFLQLLFH